MNDHSRSTFALTGDYHMHFTSQKLTDEMVKLPEEILGSFKPHECTADDMVAALDKAGAQKGYALSNAYGWGLEFIQVGEKEYDLVKYENDFTAEQAAKHPDRLIPFLSIHPLKKYALAEMDRCVSQLGLHALKLHFTNSDVDLRKPEHVTIIKELLTHADHLQLPVLIHFRSRNPEFGAGDAAIFLEQIVSTLPDLKVQMAHLGDWGACTETTRSIFNEFIRAFDEKPALNRTRFYLDLAAVIMTDDNPLNKVIPPPTPEELACVADQMRRWGIDHMLFGTDWPIMEPREYASLLLEKLPLTDEEFKILFSNKGMI
jgi:uncharacterized protein